MTEMRKVLAAISVATALMSCATGEQGASLSALNGEWDIVKVNGKGVVVAEGETAPFIGFNSGDKLVYGSTGCNRITGRLNADPQKREIDFGALGSTRMMCRDMQTEQMVLDALKDIKTFKIKKKNSVLVLGNENGKAVVELKKRP